MTRTPCPAQALPCPIPDPASSSDSGDLPPPRPFLNSAAQDPPAWPWPGLALRQRGVCSAVSSFAGIRFCKIHLLQKHARSRAPGDVPWGPKVTLNVGEQGPCPGGRGGAGTWSGATPWDGPPGSSEGTSQVREPPREWTPGGSEHLTACGGREERA